MADMSMKKFLLFSTLSAISVLFADFTIVKDGKPAAAIVLGDRPVKSAQMGAFELQHHVKMMTGATLPIVKKEKEAGKLNIIQIGGENADLKGESNRIRFSGRKLLLTGGDKKDYGKVDYNNYRTFPGNDYHCRGSLYAVYDFLEYYCGFRFYFFDDSDTCFKPSRNLSVKEKNREFTPSFDAHRQIWISSREDFDKLFKYTPRQVELWRMRWRLGNLYGFANHNQASLWFKHWKKAKTPKLAEYFAGHKPELFAQGYKGKGVGADPILTSNYPGDRDLPAQPCYTNPETIEHFAQEVVTYYRGGCVPGGWGNQSGAYPAKTNAIPRIFGTKWFYPLEGGDNPHYCKCKNCQALVPQKKGSWNQHDSNMKFAFIAKVAKRVAEIEPDAGISTLAYITNLSYPDKIRLPENVAVGICLTNYTWWHPVVYKKQMEQYKKWVNHEGKKRILTLWTYIFSTFWDAEIHFGKYKPFPGLYPWKVGEQFKMFGQDGIRGWFTCIQLQYNHLEGYIAAKLSYDKSLDPNEIIDEYFRNYYGKAGDVMKQFYKEVEQIYWNPANYPAAWSKEKNVVLGPNGPKHPHWCTGMHSPEVNHAMGTEERFKRLNSLIEQAQKLVSTANEKKHLARVVDLIWKPALEGQQYFRWLENKKKQGARAIACPKISDGRGNPLGIKWDKIPSTGTWTDVYGKDVKSQCSVKAVMDHKFIYLKLNDKAAAGKPVLDTWSDNFEMFFSADGNYPILQIAIGRSGSSLQLLHNLVNDAASRTQKNYDLLVAIKDDKKSGFSVYLAIPREAIPGNNAFLCNFMRTDRSSVNQAWAPVFTTRYLHGMKYGGMLMEFPMTVDCSKFRFTSPQEAAISADPAAPGKKAAWMKGKYSWALTWNMPKEFPKGRFKVYAWMRSDSEKGKNLTYRIGFYNPVTKKSQFTRALPVDEFAGKEYKRVLLSTFDLSGGLRFFVGGFNGKKLPGDNKIWIHSLEIEPVPANR